MNRSEVVKSLCSSGVVGIVRVESGEALINIAEALLKGGLDSIEITMSCPGAVRAIEKARAKLNDAIIGAGTVLDAQTARLCILSGAQFIVTPTVEPEVIEVSHRYGVPVIPGGTTITEILRCWEMGADMVKVFPAKILGPEYLKAIHAPLPYIPFMPTGGISVLNAGEFVRAGASVIGVGGELVDKQAVRDDHFSVLTERASKLSAAVKAAREGMSTE